MIWEIILGGEFVHIKASRSPERMSSKFKIKGQICHAKISEDEVQQMYDSENVEPVYWKEGNHHNVCRNAFFGYGACQKNLEVDLLRSCRQIYNEAQRIPYTSNTFSFNNPDRLKDFIHFLSESGNSHNLSMRKLHLAMRDTYATLKTKWHATIRLAVQQLKHLQQVNFNLYLSMGLLESSNKRPELYGNGQRILSEYKITSAIEEMQKLPLQRATCVIYDTWFESIDRINDDHFCCSLADQKKFASIVKEYILRSSTQREIANTGSKVRS